MTTIGLLNMDDLPRRARSVLGDYPELYAFLLRDQPVETVSFDVHRGELPESIADCDGWIIGGSRRSVYEDLQWIRDGEELVRAMVAAERPVVGICFGHQMVASALGGKVEAAEVGWGLGALEYGVVDTHRWYAADRLTLIASHRDQVTELPPGATVWAAADYCPVAGMTVGERVWTVQGHPEFTAAVADVLYGSRVDSLGAETIERARSTLRRPLSNDAVAAAIVDFVDR